MIAFFKQGLIPVVGWGVSAAVAAGVTEAIGWTVAVDMAKNYRIDWERQKNAKDAADAYAEVKFCKNAVDDNDNEAEEFDDD